MLRISKLTDYGTMILVHLANRSGQLCSASDVALATRVALPTVRKLLKALARGQLVRAERGTDGGYRLCRPPATITAAEILAALEGPLGITECSTAGSRCELEAGCTVGSAWRKIDRAIRSALDDVTLADLAHPPREFPLVDLSGRSGKIRHRLPAE
ncbi:MAG: SUF system Fe-S cluster assembly regulator [Gammaproteobacteria bacterium]|nr:SUF system Fe-S cluster assembly regulator [Gammaproteobacteria bacterium]